MQDSVLNLFDLFSSLDSIDSAEVVNNIVAALSAINTNDATIDALGEMLEYCPILNHVQEVALLVRASLPSMDPLQLIEEAMLSQTQTSKTLTKPSWDTFAKARPIIIKSNAGVFL